MTEVIMPKMGDGMEEGTLLEWLKKDGEKVKSGEVIGTIQTDKATLELEAPGSGFLRGILIKSGDTVPVGRPIALLLKDGEEIPSGWGSGEAKIPAAVATPAASAAAAAPAPVSAPMSAPTSAPSTERLKASPLARKVAAASGIELATITGTGPGGRIIEKDVQSAIASGSKGSGGVASVPLHAAAADKKVPLNRLRSIIADRTQHSKSTVPHFYVTLEVDVDKILDLRHLFEVEESGKVSVNDFVVLATTKALQDMPEVNASFAADHILQYGAVHIGIAVAVADGLLVPVIKNADQKTLRQLSAEAKELAKKARDGKLHPDEMSGSTFSISNMGMLDVDNFGAIINEPNAGIIAVGTARRRPMVVENDEIVIKEMMNITGSFDHRVVDGAIGARFMNVVKGYLENPTRLLS